MRAWRGLTAIDFAVFNKTNRRSAVELHYGAGGGRGRLAVDRHANGLTRYRDGRFRTYTMKDGLPDDAVTGCTRTMRGTLWIVAGVYLEPVRATASSRISRRGTNCP